MDKAAFKKHEIYHKLTGFSEQELGAIAEFIDFMRHKKKIKDKKNIKLEGILKKYDIDLSHLKTLKDETWKHVDEEASDG
jgi:predicted nucleic acid-binding protein